MKTALLLLLLCWPLCAQPTCNAIVYNNLLTQEQQFDYFESKFSTATSPIIVFLHGGGWQASGNTCTQSNICAHYTELNNLGFNVIHLRYAATGGTGGGIWPIEQESVRAFFGYLTHWINQSNNGCTIHGNIHDIRQYSFSAGGLMLLWNITGSQSLWTSNAQYTDSGWTVTYSVCESCPNNAANIYQLGDATAVTAIAGLLGCAPTLGSGCANTTAVAATPGLNITQLNSPLLVITGNQDLTVVPSTQADLITELQAAGWTPQHIITPDGSGTCVEAATSGSWDRSCHSQDWAVISTYPFTFPPNMLFDSAAYCPNQGAGGTTGPYPCGDSGLTWPEAKAFLTEGGPYVPVGVGQGFGGGVR